MMLSQDLDKTKELQSHIGASCMKRVYYLKVKIAGKNIEIESYNKRVLYRFIDYIASFDTCDYVVRADVTDVYRMSLSIWGNKFEEFAQNDVVATDFDGVELLALLRNTATFLVRDDILLMHSAAIAVNGKCFLFTAPSKTGKTTHVMNWIKRVPGSFILNGDKPFINVDTKLVYGTPWCGKEHYNKNTAVKLAGIIELKRGTYNIIKPKAFKDMIPIIIQECFIPEGVDAAVRVYKCIQQLSTIPCYQLECNMDEESALVAYNGLLEKDKNA